VVAAGAHDHVLWRSAPRYAAANYSRSARKDVQLLDGHLRVREALVKGRFTTPKSKTSRRLIELGPRTKQLLAQHWQATPYNTDDDLVIFPKLKRAWWAVPSRGLRVRSAQVPAHAFVCCGEEGVAVEGGVIYRRGCRSR
jgi:hypothetical protein